MTATPEQIAERHAWQARVRELAPAAASVEELRAKAGPAPEGMLYVDATLSSSWTLAHNPRPVEDEPSTAPRGTKTRGDRRLIDFLPDNSDEEWFHCKSPFLRFAVSNHRRV